MSKATRFSLIALFTVAALAFRWLPHPANFSPLFAIALFCGMLIRPRTLAFIYPLGLMLVSDIWLGFHSTWFFVYAPFVFAIVVGLGWQKNQTFTSWAGRVFAGSFLFFVISNFGVWLVGGLYPLTLEGLGAAYAMGIPFFKNSLAGDLFFSAVLMGFYQLAMSGFMRSNPSRPLPQ